MEAPLARNPCGDRRKLYFSVLCLSMRRSANGAATQGQHSNTACPKRERSTRSTPPDEGDPSNARATRSAQTRSKGGANVGTGAPPSPHESSAPPRYYCSHSQRHHHHAVCRLLRRSPPSHAQQHMSRRNRERSAPRAAALPLCRRPEANPRRARSTGLRSSNPFSAATWPAGRTG